MSWRVGKRRRKRNKCREEKKDKGLNPGAIKKKVSIALHETVFCGFPDGFDRIHIYLSTSLFIYLFVFLHQCDITRGKQLPKKKKSSFRYSFNENRGKKSGHVQNEIMCLGVLNLHEFKSKREEAYSWEAFIKHQSPCTHQSCSAEWIRGQWNNRLCSYKRCTVVREMLCSRGVSLLQDKLVMFTGSESSVREVSFL